MLNTSRLVLVLSSAIVLAGCELDDLSVTIRCDGFSWSASQARATIDNTGNEPPEQLTYIRVYDGLNNLLYEQMNQSPVGQSVGDPFSSGGSSYTTPPQANPIRVQFISPAGFDLAEDTVWYERSGTCDVLGARPIPSLSAWAMALLAPAMLVLGWKRRRTG